MEKDIKLVDCLKEDVELESMPDQMKANIARMVGCMKQGMFSPTDLGREIGVSRRTIYNYQKLLGKDFKKKLYDLSSLIAETEISYYAKKERLERHIKRLSDIVEEQPNRYKVWKALVKLEYCVNRLDESRLTNLRTLRVIPMKGETKFVKVSGGYVRSNVGIYEKNEDEADEEVKNEPERAVKKETT